MSMNEPAVDLGILLAIFSSYKDVSINDGTMAFGEVGLSGEVRAVSQADTRVMEAKKLGFKKVILPKANMNSCRSVGDIQLMPVDSIKEAISFIYAARK